VNAKTIRPGLYGGLAGGLVFGVMMAMMGMLPMIGKMVGSPSAVTGFFAHMLISAMIGTSFGVLFNWAVFGVPSGLVYGIAYGGFWWLLGPLTLMPFFMGMGLGINWNAAAAKTMLPSLWGHVIFGLILGATYGWLKHRSVGRVPASENHATAARAA
jgi:hypothetical protein